MGNSSRVKCKTCSYRLYISRDWINPPTTCEICQVKKIQNVRSLLNQFIKEGRFNCDPDASNYQRLRKRAIELSRTQQGSKDFYAFLRRDTELRKTLIRLNRASLRRRYDNRKPVGNNFKPQYKGSGHIVSGGLPSLGSKR